LHAVDNDIPDTERLNFDHMAWQRHVCALMVGMICAAASTPAASGVTERRPASTAEAQARPVVLVVPVEGMIDLGLPPFIERVLEQANARRAAAVVLEVNTLGGRLDAAVLIRDNLLESPVRTIAFVDKRAISAGALITLAAKEIVMAPGATIGAATPVKLTQGGRGAEPVDEKTVSYVRKEFRATAESRGRPVKLADAMVDADVDLPGLAPKGKLLTLTADEAVQRRVADRRVADIPELLRAVGLGGALVERIGVNWAERVVRWLTHPIVSSLLMTIAVFGILIELRTPGFGLPGILGLLALAAFLWGHWLVRLAGWEELLLIGGGIALLLLELFALPGFGAAGVLGIAAILAGLTLSLVGSGASAAGIASAALRVAFSLTLSLAGGLLLLRFLPKLKYGRRLVLEAALPAGEGTARVERGPTKPAVDRDTGRALTPLRPAGTAALAGERVDVVSDGDFVEAGETVEVVRRDGNRVVVRRIPAPA
jgi:membrane-bound serine protease (ClpP class)